MKTQIDGKHIAGVGPHYEQIGIRMSDGSFYYMSYSDLHTVLNEFVFDLEKKRTRTWIHPVTPDVDLLYHQENYPTEEDN
jgi:hypothetical protein